MGEGDVPFDPSRPHVSRVYDYLLGGTDNFAADRAVGDQIPAIRAHLDWNQPIGLLLRGIVHYILDSDGPVGLVPPLTAGLPPGSYVFIHHLLDTVTRPRRGCRRRCSRGWAACSSARWRRWGSCSATLNLLGPGLLFPVRTQGTEGSMITSTRRLSGWPFGVFGATGSVSPSPKTCSRPGATPCAISQSATACARNCDSR